jgi:hypothetical protein
MARHKQVTTCRKTGGPLSDRCSCEHCTLAVCSVCGGYEGSLTTDCSRETLSFDRQKEIYETNLDYVESRGWHQGEPMQRRSPLFEGGPPHCPIMTKYDVPSGQVMRIIGCGCGWKVPDREQNPDEAWSMHAAIAKIAPSHSTFAKAPVGTVSKLHVPTYSGCKCGWKVPDREQNFEEAWSAHSAITNLHHDLSQKAFAWVLAARILEDHDASLTRVEDEVDAYLKPGQEMDARGRELHEKLEYEKMGWKLADDRARTCDEEFHLAAKKLVEMIER